jgi:hypothetical protein
MHAFEKGKKAYKNIDNIDTPHACPCMLSKNKSYQNTGTR